MKLPIRARLTLVAAVAMSVVLALGGVVLYLLFSSGLRDAVDQGLEARAETIIASIDSSGGGFADEGSILDPEEAFAQVVGAHGSLLDSSEAFEQALVVAASDLAGLGGRTFFDRSIPTDEGPVPARILAVPTDEGPVVVVGASLEDQRDALTQLATLLLIGIPLAVLATAGVGWMLAGAALRPVGRMRVETQAISVGDLDRRLSVPDSGDELAQLGETLNALLERLERSVERERRFVDDASHELRTPLTVLKGEIELALRTGRSKEELLAALRSAGEETDRLHVLADDLLVLARAQRGRLPLRASTIDLGDLARSAVDSMTAWARKGEVTVEARGSASASVDPDRIRQVVDNLLMNAVAATPRGGSVGVDVRTSDRVVSLDVTDTGPGFPNGGAESAFEPFTRGNDARSRTAGGAGLGLAIVRAIVQAHGGSVNAGASPDGTGACVSVRLPAAAASD